MTLGSQAPRSGSTRQYMFRKRRRALWPFLLLLVMIVALAGFLIVEKLGDEKKDTASRNPSDYLDSNSNPDVPRNNDAGTNPQSNGNNAPAPGRGDANPRPSRPIVNPSDPVTQDPAPVRPDNGGGTSRVNPGNPPDNTGTTNNLAVTPDPTPPVTRNDGPIGDRLAEARNLVQQQRLVPARRILSDLLFYPPRSLSDAELREVRTSLAQINDVLVFSPTVLQDDPIIGVHTVASGDRLTRIAYASRVTAGLLGRINGIDPNRIRIGQDIKTLRGPLHVRVIKSKFIMDVYALDATNAPVHVVSFPVGLGEFDSTPVGSWLVENGRKAVNPDWRDDRTGTYFGPDDPANPIGEYWLALEGTDERTESLSGYGIHGTIEQDSIGTMASRGCIRLADDDIALVFDLLIEGESRVDVVP